MAKVAFISMKDIEPWSSSDCYDYNTLRIVEKISDWHDVPDEELHLLRKYFHRTRHYTSHRIVMLVQEDYTQFQDAVMLDIKKIISDEKKEEAKRIKEAAELEVKKAAAAEKRKLKQKALLIKEAQELGLQIVEGSK